MKLRWRKVQTSSGDYGFILEQRTATMGRQEVWTPITMEDEDMTLFIGTGRNANHIFIQTTADDISSWSIDDLDLEDDK